jgi:hypothetical protein
MKTSDRSLNRSRRRSKSEERDTASNRHCCDIGSNGFTRSTIARRSARLSCRAEFSQLLVKAVAVSGKRRRVRVSPGGILSLESVERASATNCRSTADALAAAHGRRSADGLDPGSLSVAHKTGALTTKDLERVVVDTTVQPNAIAHPTDARLCHRALEKLVDLARHNKVPLRQSYRRVAQARGEWSGATPMRTSSSERGANSSSCAFGLAA